MKTPLAAAWFPLLQEALAREGRFRFPLRGTSMRPTLPDGCEVEIVPLPDNVPIGSVVVFAAGDSLIAHRLVRRCGGHWILQGDGRLGPDKPLSPDRLLGLAVTAYRSGQRIWPGRWELLLRRFWVARYHALRPLRFAWRVIRKNAMNRGSFPGQAPTSHQSGRRTTVRDD